MYINEVEGAMYPIYVVNWEYILCIQETKYIRWLFTAECTMDALWRNANSC